MSTFSFDPIGWTYDAAAYCLEHEPSTEPDRDGNVRHPVFETDRASFEDGGLSCETCSATIVETDTCRQCDRSIRDDHSAYAYGTTDGTSRRLVHEDRCRPGRHAVIRVQQRCGSRWSIAVSDQVVPFATDPAEALDAIVAAYAGTVATFDIVETEEVPS
jgi:hypothetical protein